MVTLAWKCHVTPMLFERVKHEDLKAELISQYIKSMIIYPRAINCYKVDNRVIPIYIYTKSALA